jgi:lysophospholipase L1-like esterase
MKKSIITVVLVGDSDISRWPPSLYPEGSKIKSGDVEIEITVVNLGQSGAVLSDLLPQVNQWRTEQQSIQTGCNSPNRINIFIACAGENDVGSGRSVDGLLETFRTFLDELFPRHSQSGPNQGDESKSYLLFLGSKFEPWLSEDMSSRKQYTQLAKALHRTIRKHPGFGTNRIMFVDCLTMFCTKESCNVPGAIYGGRALPDKEYFDVDGLHLSEKGYQFWKQITEEEISKMLAMID